MVDQHHEVGHWGDLAWLLQHRNGFYAFESALHIYPSSPERAGETDPASPMSLERWNEPDLWRNDYGDLANGLAFFAEDIFGTQFALSQAGVGAFDPETAEVEILAPDLDGWAQLILSDSDYLTGHPLAHRWQAQFGPIPPGSRLVPKLPFVLGGEFELENVTAMDAVKGMKWRATVAEEVRQLPDQTKNRLRLI